LCAAEIQALQDKIAAQIAADAANYREVPVKLKPSLPSASDELDDGCDVYYY
jgi:hypothetical protein